ncbi:MAG: dolichyl-phosphate-mannose--protein mannosyltransferase, partial [Patescibacteria group bacterium]|nr:dolichyl-phosphate-mannose--protein mannosyltransferase [Patescibacteria group bacterium]
IYFLSYSQYFFLRYSLKDFFALHQQIYLYQTGLTATHSYQSFAWQWPLLIKPVWFYVQYNADKISNIYNLGNPIIFWGGLLALATSIRSVKPFLLISYLFLFIPFIFSPRILFLHHYLPALPPLCLIIAKTLYQNKKFIFPFLSLTFITFLFFYPLNIAIPIPNNLLKFWFWLPTWK